MLQLLLGLLSHLTFVQLVTVERNMFAYYKVPQHLLLMSENPVHPTWNNYYVLQCPPKLSKDIPRPQEMQTCNVIGSYKEKNSMKLHTKVDYMLKRNKPNYSKPMTSKTVLRSLMPDSFYKTSFSHIEPKNVRYVRYQRSTGTKPLNEESAELIDHEDSDEDDMDLEDESNEKSLEFSTTENDGSALKYLGVKNVISKLLQEKIQRLNDSDSAFMTLNADHKNFKKGNRTKGYQHIYHRDENFKDHIFYDDLEEHGKYSIYGKSHETLD